MVNFFLRSDWNSPEGSYQNQFVSIGTGQRHFGAGGRQVQSHSVPRLETDSTAAGFAGRQHQDADDRLHFTGRRQLRRNAEHAQVRQPGQKHHQPAQDQSGSQRSHAQRVPAGNRTPPTAGRPSNSNDDVTAG